MKRVYFYLTYFLSIYAIGCASVTNVDKSSQSVVALIPIEEIKKSAEIEKKEMLDFLSKTITYKSVEDYGYELKPATKDLMEYVFQTAEKMGYETKLAANGLVGVSEYGKKGGESVGVLIHLDVVPADSKEWDNPPFSGEEIDGNIWGRGSQDNKGPLALTLWAGKILIDRKFPFQRQLRIILGTKEEKSFESLTEYFRTTPQPTFGLVPDGVYLIHGEKGIADIDYTFEGLTPEASKRDKIVYWKGGLVVNSVPDLSYVVVKSNNVEATCKELESLIKEVTEELAKGSSRTIYGLAGGVNICYKPDIHVTDYKSFVREYPDEEIPEQGDLVFYSKGVAAHSSVPWFGRNAIVEVAFVGNRMTEISNNAYKRAFDFTTSKIGLNDYGNGLGIRYRDENLPDIQFIKDPPIDIYVQYYGTSMNLGLVKVDSEKNRLVLSADFRTGFKNTNLEILEKSKETVAQFQGQANYQEGIGSHYESFVHDLDSPLIQLVGSSYKEVTGDSPKYLVIGSSSYLKLVKNFTNFGPVDIFAGEKDFVHKKNERIEIERMKDDLVLFTHTLQKMIQIDVAPIQGE